MDAIGKLAPHRNVSCLRTISLAALLGASSATLADATQAPDYPPPYYAQHRDHLLSGAEPVAIPLKALVERLAFGPSASRFAARPFRYDIDTLGQGLSLRVRLRF